MEAKIAVMGDSNSGKTLLCHRLQRGSQWALSSDAAQQTKNPTRQEFFFATYEEGASLAHRGFKNDTTAKTADDDQWYDVTDLSRVSLKLIEPCGANRSSLQQIIFRNVCGLFVVVDVMVLWEEFLATDTTPIRDPAERRVPDGSDNVRSSTMDPCGWQLFLNQTIMYWVRMAIYGSNFSETYGVRFPVFVVFTRTDVLLRAMGVRGAGTTEPKSAAATRKSDGVAIPTDHFFRHVTEFCCGEQAESNASRASKGPTSPRHARQSGGGRRHNDLLRASLPAPREWCLDPGAPGDALPALACDGCYFVSSVSETDCPNRTHQVVNDMVEIMVDRVFPIKYSVHAPPRTAPSKKRSPCCDGSKN